MDLYSQTLWGRSNETDVIGHYLNSLAICLKQNCSVFEPVLKPSLESNKMTYKFFSVYRKNFPPNNMMDNIVELYNLIDINNRTCHSQVSPDIFHSNSGGMIQLSFFTTRPDIFSSPLIMIESLALRFKKDLEKKLPELSNLCLSIEEIYAPLSVDGCCWTLYNQNANSSQHLQDDTDPIKRQRFTFKFILQAPTVEKKIGVARPKPLYSLPPKEKRGQNHASEFHISRSGKWWIGSSTQRININSLLGQEILAYQLSHDIFDCNCEEEDNRAMQAAENRRLDEESRQEIRGW